MMKKVFLGLMLLAVIFIGLGFSKSSGKSSTIEKKRATEVAKSFFKALDQQNYKKAKRYATKESHFMLDFLANEMPKPENFGGEIPRIRFKVQRVTVSGDTAVAIVRHIYPEKSQESENIGYDMVKEDGDWKVSFGKH